ncbi:DMT family transporter [Falsibacillus pallidus]|uniref:Small multidrug resistance pump n=1 Tax=Falsibacillus pallidus TaxID=493781 RepID=A0A370GPD8_9BACI|nr:multidrug efflux SMR transporter [Falsibacillus pallidus]RDI45391.1 small multidrug resistance pump [Falsibacillus pallidus]
MKAYIFLAAAIASELIGTSMLKASDGFTKAGPAIGVVLGFASAFFFLSLSLKMIPLSIAYAIWSGAGTAATAVIGVLIWKEKISMATLAGIILIIAGVIVINLKTQVEK